MDEEILTTNYDKCYIASEKIPLIEWEQIIKKCFGNDTIIQWKKDIISQLDFGSDVLITTNKGRKYSMDVKTRRNEYLGYNEWLFEIAHHRYKDKTKQIKINTIPGWLYKSTSDLILFSTINNNKILEAVCFSLIPFKNEGFIGFNDLYNGWAATIFKNGIYQVTLNKKVPLTFIKEKSNYYWYWKFEQNNDKNILG